VADTPVSNCRGCSLESSRRSQFREKHQGILSAWGRREKGEHLTFAAKLEIGVRSQEPGARRKEEEGRSQKKCFYKYEMLPEKGEGRGSREERKTTNYQLLITHNPLPLTKFQFLPES
jgi:hypothetical protein